MNAPSVIGWRLQPLQGVTAKVIVADDDRNIGVLYASEINPQSAQDGALLVAAPKLQAALAELVAALNEALSAIDVAGSVYSIRMDNARDAADAALGAVAVVEPRR
ncbi:hypothetical protein [Rhodopseudomonas sp.]|uniref:hypothetical protein n=1 Tax=Rhodopseudomonas sp. TaxID=1078 RepID=UPI003B3A9039